MNYSKKQFLNQLSETSLDSDLSAIELSSLYINSALLVTVMEFVKEQLWLKNKEDKNNSGLTSYKDFLTILFEKDLENVGFLESYLEQEGSAKIRSIGKNAKDLENLVVERVLQSAAQVQKEFLSESLARMSDHYIEEENYQDDGDFHNGLCLYRTFDRIDDVFDLDYKLDQGMIVAPGTSERIFKNSGVGVQSGYSTILLALDIISPKQGSRVIDLGSGYGRVGLVCSLIRPDLDIIGYEYVDHRVTVANSASQYLGLEENLDFQTQDLSKKDFNIPVADIYYLYDPFTKETYQYVLKQIVEISKKQKVTIVTKGNAKVWIKEIADKLSWPAPKLIHSGNLCIFESH